MLLIGFRSASGGLTVVSAANPLPVTGGGGGGGGVSATVSENSPDYSGDEGTEQSLSLDFDGNLRVVVAGGAGAVTVADGADVTQGSIATAAYSGTPTAAQGYLRAMADAAISTDPASTVMALLGTTDMTPGNVTRSGAGEQSMVTATASQTTKLYGYAVTVPGAGTVEIRDGAGGAALRKHIFPDKGGIIRDIRGRPYAKTTANTALVFYWSGTGDANIDFDYVKGA